MGSQQPINVAHVDVFSHRSTNMLRAYCKVSHMWNECTIKLNQWTHLAYNMFTHYRPMQHDRSCLGDIHEAFKVFAVLLHLWIVRADTEPVLLIQGCSSTLAEGCRDDLTNELSCTFPLRLFKVNLSFPNWSLNKFRETKHNNCMPVSHLYLVFVVQFLSQAMWAAIG